MVNLKIIFQFSLSKNDQLQLLILFGFGKELHKL